MYKDINRRLSLVTPNTVAIVEGLSDVFELTTDENAFELEAIIVTFSGNPPDLTAIIEEGNDDQNWKQITSITTTVTAVGAVFAAFSAVASMVYRVRFQLKPAGTIATCILAVNVKSSHQ